MTRLTYRLIAALLAVVLLASLAPAGETTEGGKSDEKTTRTEKTEKTEKGEKAKKPPTRPANVPADWVVLKHKLPKAAFTGTPKNIPKGIEMPAKRPPELYVPKGAENLAKGKPVTSSDTAPIIGELKCVTDGDAGPEMGKYVELMPGVQWVQIDLKKKAKVHVIRIWHRHDAGRVYRDVVIQTAKDADFIEGVKTHYNNDSDNSAGLGLGKDIEYLESNQGKTIILPKGVPTRYVRFYSNGAHSSDMNHYTEVEIYGVPVKK